MVGISNTKPLVVLLSHRERTENSDGTQIALRSLPDLRLTAHLWDEMKQDERAARLSAGNV